MVEKCAPQGLLSQVVQIRINGLDETMARDRILEGIRRERNKPCGVPLRSQARDLGCVGYFASDGVLELSVFKTRGAIPERVQTT